MFHVNIYSATVYSSVSTVAMEFWPLLFKQRMKLGLLPFGILTSKLDWFLSTIHVIWEKIAALIEFS